VASKWRRLKVVTVTREAAAIGARPAQPADRAAKCGIDAVLCGIQLVDPASEPTMHGAPYRATARLQLHPVKAAVIYENGAPDALSYEDVTDPECPQGCVLIDVEAISIEGGDLLARAGSPPPSTPHIVGYLAAGTVRSVGAGVEDISVGEQIVTLNAAGSHASKRVVPAMSTWRIPAGLDAARAACVPVAFGTAQECLFTAGSLEGGQTVLVHAGAGGVGMAAIQLAKQAGATVISTASSDEKLERLKEFGLDHGVNYASENFVQRTRELTDGRGVDVILDSVGGQNLVDSVGALAYRGRLISVGVAGRAGSAIEARDLWAQNNSLHGVFLGGALLSEYPRVHAMIAELLERVARGELRVEIDRTFALAEAVAAHAYLESRQAFGRVVMVP
jgi:NADPH2:quinone reductase